MLRRLAAVFLALHGLVHWIGFAVPWGLMPADHFTNGTTVLWGGVNIGESGARFVALLWLPVLAAFLLAAYGVWRSASWSMPVTAMTAAASLVICLLASPDAIIGDLVDVAILAVVAAPSFRERTNVLGLR